jgi:lipopolysaccharide/colanic/teichoic acid biosynthesis glycosyltransferase
MVTPLGGLGLSVSAAESIRLQGAFRRAASRAPRRAARPTTLCRALDLLIALPLGLFVAPLMVMIALIIKLQDGGPALFVQERVGRDGRLFRCWKFRTMVADAEARLDSLLACDEVARREWAADHKLRRDPRVTRFGELLRISSLDELPQLFNVLAGDMSLVGPRPIVRAEVERYGRWIQHYCAVRPGLTGVWQVNGRNDVSYRRRVAMDVLFVRRLSPQLYLRIMAATPRAVVRRHGSY